MLLILKDGTEFTVRRPFWYQWRETPGFHHFKIVDTAPDSPYRKLIGKRVAVPLSDIRFLTIEEEQ